MDDVISRQAAIDALDGHFAIVGRSSAERFKMYIEAVINDIRKLPPAQLGTNLAEVGTDCISRWAAIDALRAMQTYKLFAGDDMLLIDQAGAMTELMLIPPRTPIQELLNVTADRDYLEAQCHVYEQEIERIKPKTGKWILDRSGAYCCSKCMEPCAGYVMMKPRDKFCKMCGSRNEVKE